MTLLLTRFVARVVRCGDVAALKNTILPAWEVGRKKALKKFSVVRNFQMEKFMNDHIILE